MQNNRRYFAGVSVVVVVAIALFVSSMAMAQITTAALSGTVLDASGAVVPNANVTLTNESSGNIRRTVSNGEGYFTFAAVPPGSYTVSVEGQGFKKWEAKGVVLNAADKRAVTGIKLEPGATTETVVVEASAAQITPIDSGEKSALITEKTLQNVAIVGQNAAEFVKIMPGMALTGGTVNINPYNSQDERTGNSPGNNSIAPNGLRVAALDITSDGAHIIDPGCNCGQAVNTNIEMTSEVKVLTSNFGADVSKGPVLISAISKSGGNQFHGEGYFYLRHFGLNANDWQNNAAGKGADGNLILPRPETKYFYPGFQISGPVIIPGTSFNKNRDKLFFFFGTQYYKQYVDNGIYKAAVPSQAMRDGDFSDAAYLASLNGGALHNVPNGSGYTNGILTIDPNDANQVLNHANGLALMNTYPLPNVDPSLPQNQGFNYVNSQTRYSNMFQIRAKVDYSITDSTKFYVAYNRQRDDAQESLDTLWTGNGQSWASPTTPYPSPLIEKSQSDVITAGLTKVFSPTLTNETVFSYVYLNLPNSFANKDKVTRDGLGLNYNMLFDHPNPGNLIFPQMTGWGNGISNQLNSGFELGGVVYAKKTLPSVSDNLTKVWGTHTTKFGFYWERTFNQQPGNGAVNGTAVFADWAGATGNGYANMLIGSMTQYSEQNFNTVPAFRYMTSEFYGQDSWKVSRRVTLEYGLRVSHLGPWSDTTGFGFGAWYQNLYDSNQGGTATTPGGQEVFFRGIEWNKVNKATPPSGADSRLFFYNPRVGFAWDLFGTGNTVLRGGYGMYRYHDEQNVQNGAYGITQGAFANPAMTGVHFSDLAPYAGNFPTPSGVQALDPHDNQQPRAQSYSFTVAQRMPWKSVLEVAYVGNKADYLSNYNNNFSQINDPPIGTLFQQYGWLPNCDPSLTDGSGASCDHPDGNHRNNYTDAQVAAARPLSAYGTVKIINHKMYSNYNSMQVSWNKQAGPFTFMTNYTYSKALGIRGENGAGSGDPTNLKNNYGTLPNNRTQIFNLAYVYQTPKIHSANAFAKGLLNDWQVSGIVQYQSGSDIQEAVGNYDLSYQAYIPAGTTFMGTTLAVPILAGQQNGIGSPDITLMPKLNCDPRVGLKAHQYMSSKCFSNFVTPGEQGTYIFPTMTGPGFFNTDLSLFKNFVFGASESKKLQFRFSGYNFLNHPVRTFIKGDPGLQLHFDQDGNPVNVGGTEFGVASNKIGHRILQMSVKFSW